MLSCERSARPSCLMRPLVPAVPAIFRPGPIDVLCDLGPDGCRLLDDRFFYITQLILAKEHFLTDEECRRAKGPAIDRVGSVFDQLFLDVVLLGAGNQAVDVDAG